MDYRIFNVRTFLGVRIQTGHTDESAQHGHSEKLSQICIVLRTGFKPLVTESIGRPTLYQLSHQVPHVV